jgi:hypothetical protein
MFIENYIQSEHLNERKQNQTKMEKKLIRYSTIKHRETEINCYVNTFMVNLDVL